MSKQSSHSYSAILIWITLLSLLLPYSAAQATAPAAVEDALDDYENGRSRIVDNVTRPAARQQPSAITPKKVAYPAAGKKKLTFETGYEVYDYKYEEFVQGQHFIDIKGIFQGIFGVLIYRPEKNKDVMAQWADIYRIEAKFATAKVDYNGGVYDPYTDYHHALSVSGRPDMTYEVRGLLAGDFKWKDFGWSPYAGIGWRWLEDDGSDEHGVMPPPSAAPHNEWRGYRRVSNYSYLPLGFDLTKELPDQLDIKLNLEYDWGFNGEQKSYADQWVWVPSRSELVYCPSPMKHEQNKGYGLRGSLRISKQFEKHDLFIEPFVRYWKIGDSENTRYEDYWPNTDLIVLGQYEPNNETHEFGLKAGVSF